MKLDFLEVLKKRLQETAIERQAQMTAVGERMALEGLREAGGSMTTEAFAATWEVLGDVMLRHLESRGWARRHNGRVELTESGRAALQD